MRNKSGGNSSSSRNEEKIICSTKIDLHLVELVGVLHVAGWLWQCFFITFF